MSPSPAVLRWHPAQQDKVDIWKLEQKKELQHTVSFAVGSFKVWEDAKEALHSKGIH